MGTYNKGMVLSGEVASVRSAAISDPGRKREGNEDSIACQPTPYGGIFVVADGVGGNAAGEVASSTAVKTILAVLQSKGPSSNSLAEAIFEANAEINNLAKRPDRQGMSTTTTALLLDLPYATIAHAGDSRAYLLRGGQLIRLTNDHTWVADRVRQGLLSEAEAENHFWGNVVTNALGASADLQMDLIGLKARRGDLYFICSDGLYGVVDERVMQEVFSNEPLEDAVAHLVRLANDWGGPDNISLVAIQVESIPQRANKSYEILLEDDGPAVRHAPGTGKSNNRPDWVGVAVVLLYLALFGFVVYNEYINL